MCFGTSTKYMVETPLHIKKHYSEVCGPKIRHRFCNNLILAHKRMMVLYIIFCPYKILPTMRNSPHRTHYIRLQNLAHRAKFSPTKIYSCEAPPVNALPYHFPQITHNPRRQ
ncbi:hypothetical protein Y032_0332g2755 [Ancylostoma ceylanicum]|uniref:Uncharacterized protein n=1 Tax=Ancylostoma ceylanicum TaxID=53326 RepID=A0A016RZ13_9BILA|nr:hypothetical protein Y032_0332g2755 [Ancylostoma ceylanicum]